MNEQDYAKIVLPAKLEMTRILPATRERVWGYLVDPELRKLWFCAGETGANPGDDFVMDFDHSRISKLEPPEGVGCDEPMVMTGRILTFDPPRELSYSWPGEHGNDTVVTIRLEQEGEHTRLHLVHERLVVPESRRGASAGWHAHLDLLVDLIDGKTPRDFWIHFATLKSEYEQRIPPETDA